MALDLGDLDKIDRIVRNAVHDELDKSLGDDEPVEIGARWTGGKLELWPRDATLPRARPEQNHFDGQPRANSRL